MCLFLTFFFFIQNSYISIRCCLSINQFFCFHHDHESFRLLILILLLIPSLLFGCLETRFAIRSCLYCCPIHLFSLLIFIGQERIMSELWIQCFTCGIVANNRPQTTVCKFFFLFSCFSNRNFPHFFYVNNCILGHIATTNWSFNDWKSHQFPAYGSCWRLWWHVQSCKSSLFVYWWY